MQPRAERLPETHPDFLHPGRTVLILLLDAGVTDPVLLAAGGLAETLHPGLAAPRDTAAAPRVRALLDQVPTPAHEGERLLEALLAASEPVRLIALAERLDHMRHLHLHPAEDWATLYRETRATYLPVAERTHPTLARRFRWWCDMFVRRYLRCEEG